MAVSIGNLALLLDVISPRTVVISDRKIRPVLADVILNLPKRDNIHATLSVKSFESSDGEAKKNQRGRVRGKANSKANAIDFDAESSDEENGNGFEEEEKFDWEKEMRKRVKEIEEMRELEKKAEELQNKAEEEGDGNNREETEEEKRMRVRKELEKVAKEQAERRATAQLMFELGQRAYGKGMYGRAIEFLEGALTIIPRPTLFGGEIQIWLAMAYEANNRHADCIALYKQLEKQHPSVSIRRQAADLRYILQSPKLKISQEEMVTIPLIGSSYDRQAQYLFPSCRSSSYAATWTDKYKERDQTRSGSTTNQLPSSRDFLGDFLVWRPPVGLQKSPAFWVFLAFWICLVGAALFIQQ
ncbi:hypothetical protein RJ641_002757 [Dillenia turbinata]|uniref:Uncharacterized protein n=1 Tax=Dillenia turbinata TaxID=194707 RepID=A0AAN8VFY5_9MAGN